MVAIISGARVGLNLSSGQVLGSAGATGNAQSGRNGQGVYVNAATGLLVVQNQDDYLAARGIDAGLLRTYNSKGSLNDDSGDGWLAGMQKLVVTGTVGAAGSTVTRVGKDGSAAVYTWDASRNLYVTTEGAGAYDTISYVSADSQFEWRDGATGATERYEGSGSYRQLTAADTSGNVLTYAYGTNGFLSSVTTANGETTFYDYSGNNLTQVRTVAGGVTTTRVHYGYDTSNRLTTVTVDLTPADNSVADLNVYKTTYTYDGTSTRVAGIQQSDGTSLSFTYVNKGGDDWRVATFKDGLNQTTSFTYAAGYTTVTDPLGLVTRYDYDASSQLTKITAPAIAGVTSTQQFAYDANGNVITVTDGESRAVTYGYDANGNQVLQRDQLGNTVTRTFDSRNQLLTQTVYLQPDPDGAGAALPGTPQTTRYVYDAGGHNLLRFTVSAEGRVTEYRYDAFGQQTASITYAAGQYPVSGLAATASPAESDLVTWAGTQDLSATQRVDLTYDGRGQLATRTTYSKVSAAGAGIADGSQSVQHFVYDQACLLLQTVSAANGTTAYTYDGLGRVLTATDANNQVTVTQYTDNNTLAKTAVTLANGLVTTSMYDAGGRVVSVLQSSSAGTLGETKYFYDADNRLRMTQDPTGVRHWMLYDEDGRKTADVDANGSMTEYTYDRSGLLVRQVAWGTAVSTSGLVDAGGLPVTTVTAAGLRPVASAGDAGLWRQYDGAGRLVREARSTGIGGANLAAITDYSYDGASHLVQTTAYAGVVTAAGTSGAVPALTAPAASGMDRVARRFYDADGRLVGSLDAEGYLTTYKYSAAGQLDETVAYATVTTASLRAAGTLAQLQPASSPADVRTVTLYDGKGQAVAQVDGEGYLTENAYDADGNLTLSVRYANRVTATVAVDSLVGTIRPATTSADRSTQRGYDALDRLQFEITPEGVRTNYAYDSVGNLVSTVRAASTSEARTFLSTYDLQGRLTGELSATGAALLTGGQTQAQIDAIWAQYGVRYAYDAAGRRISATDAAGNRTLFFYNADGALTHTVNALGEVQEQRYDARGRLTDTIRYVNRIPLAGLTGGLVPAALTTALAAAANAAADGHVSYTYMRDGAVASSTDEVGTVTTQAYDVFGDVISRQVSGAAVNLTETYTVDHRGQRTGTVQDAAGLNVITSAVYDAFGRLVRSIDGNGNVREQDFDRLGRVVTQRDPFNALRTTSYDAFGRVLTQTDELGKTTSYAYDSAARTMTVTTPEGIVTVTAYTRQGQVLSITDGKGQVTSYTYDLDGRLTQTSTPLTTSGSSYDGAGRLVQTVDADGNQVTYTYDAANRVLTRRVDPTGLNLTTTYGYDGKGQQVSVTDPNGVVTTRQFDRKGQVLRQTVDPAGLNLQTVYTYDARGSVLTVTSPGGRVTQYAYDTLGRRTQETVVDPAGSNITRSWTYDRDGNAVTSTDANGNITRYAYDAGNRLVFTVDPLGGVQQNTYDAAGRVIKSVAYATPISLTGLPTPPAVADIQARVAGQPAQDQVQNRVYDGDGRLTVTVDGTGAVTRYTYDANGNVTARTSYAARIDLSQWTPGTVPAVVADPAHDASVRTVYDALDRAIYSVDGVGAVVAQTYDGNGNVLQRTAYAVAIPTTTPLTAAAIGTAVAAVANAARDASVRNTYDAAGRLTFTVDGIGAVTQRIYDADGNLVKQVAYANAIAGAAAPSTVTASAGDRAFAMAYDAAGRLVFQVDALRGVTEQVYDADGNVVRRVQYANPIAAVPALGTSGTVAAVRAAITANAAADRTTRFGYDAAGRQALVIDATGAVTETRYDAAGHVTSQTAYLATVNTSGLPAVPTLPAMKALVVTNALADRTTYRAYDAAGRQAYEVDALGTVTATQHDALGQVTRTTRYWTPIGTASATSAAAIAAAVHPAAGQDQTCVYTYNAAGQLITSTDAIGGVESFTYDALGRKLSFVNKSGFTWTYAYDAAGRQVSETTPPVSLTSVSTNASGNLVAGASANAAIVTRLTYDALGNLTARTEALGRPEERTTQYEYDALGRQVRVVYPPVGVYNAVGDNATTNGATGVASRVETTQTLETRTFYDTLGNAVAGRDIGGAVSQKVYDSMGRVLYEVDAMGYVTGYTRNAFGDVTSLLRYAAGTTLANGTVTQASQAVTKAQVETAVNAAGVDHSKDRVLLSTYDQAGRVVETTEPATFVSSTGASGSVQTATAGKKTRNTYDAFGQLVQSRVLRDTATDTWATTTHYFDLLGHETGVIDALGYLTFREYDSMGNVASVKEFATAVAAGWTTTSYARPADNVNPDDRKTVFSYDQLNRKIAETRKDVEYSAAANGTSVRGDLTTSYAYDAVGNQTRGTDANNQSTFTYYDALGRITAVAAPARSSTASGTALTPLTEFKRDAYGNVLVKIDYANGAASATAAGYTVGAVDAVHDHTTLSAYDSFGHAVQSTDANGASAYTSYDAYGHVAKHWQGVTGNDGVTRTSFEVDTYDKLGQLVQTQTPGSTAVYTDGSGISNVGQATAGVVTTAIEYDAFGEVTRKGTQGLRQEYFDYDNAGRLWRTNTGDGVDKIYLYDAQGNQTAELRSAGAGNGDTDLKGFLNAQAATADTTLRRVDMQYDLLGRVTARSEAARQVLQGGLGIHRQFVSLSITGSPVAQSDESSTPQVMNHLAFGWNSLAALGSGDVKVSVEYMTPARWTLDENNNITGTVPGQLQSASSGIFNGDAAASGLTFDFQNTTGVGSVTRVVVYKKDLAGNWQVVVDQAPGYGSNDLTVATPPDPMSSARLELRIAGTSGTGGWWQVGLADFGGSLRFDAKSLPVGSYEYKVTIRQADGTERVTGTGTVGISMPPLNSISTTIAYNQGTTGGYFGTMPAGILTWADPGAAYTQVFRYRPNGSSGAWATLGVTQQGVTGSQVLAGVDTRGLAAGTYQYELVWSLNGVATSHATGTFTYAAPVGPQWVPPVNLPNITGITVTPPAAVGSVIGQDENGSPIYATTAVPAYLWWAAANATTARYRLGNGAWNYLTIDSSGQTTDESGLAGSQRVSLNGIAPGTYQFEIYAGSPPTAQGTANVTLYAQNPGWYETVYTQVPVQTPVVAYYAPVYETRYGTRTVAYQVYVSDPPYQYVYGYDENGQPQYYWVYPGHYETRYRQETYSYQVQVGQTPVYATDESGNIIYQTTYVTQSQQVWHNGTTPAPTAQVTTPPYTAGHWTAATPAQWGANVTTAAGSTAISGTDGSNISQAAAINGDNQMLRPTVTQTLDRWGNVLEVTDPRSAYWKTTYKYNANNQMIRQQLPDDAGAQSSGSPVTSIYYDKLGRQVAVKDANANVNGQVYDAGGNLVQELHADTGVVTNAYDAFGNKVRTTDAMGNVVGYTYDRMGHMLSTLKGMAGVYSAASNWLQQVDTRNITDSWSYDQLGRKLTQTNGNGETVKYTYDLRGNVIETWQPLGQVVRDAYDAQGNKIGEVDANGVGASWAYNYFGQLTSHKDLGGAVYTYTYDNARQLVQQGSGHGQSITYTYDAAGQVTAIHDWAVDEITSYAYDLSGRKVRERVSKAGITYQDNHLSYDARGNLRDVADARAHVVMQYDGVGNRTRVATYVDYQGVGGEAASSTDKYFKYDAMNRQIVVDAVDNAGNIGQQGHTLTYDKDGNRTSDTYWGPMVVATTTQTVTYDENSGAAIYSNPQAVYQQTNGYTTETYTYDALNRLHSVVKDGTQIDLRVYDGADRVVASGPMGALPQHYAEIINAGLTPDQMNGKETRINRYDANGRLMHQKVLKSDGSAKVDISWDSGESFATGVTFDDTGAHVTYASADGYDAAGNALGYMVNNHDGTSYVNEYSSTLTRYDGYKAAATSGTSTTLNPGNNTQGYDANGFLTSITDSTQANNSRTFVNDANGMALYVNQAGNVQRQMVVNGEVLGIYGARVNPSNPTSGYENNPNFSDIVDFEFGYSKITANYPNATPGAYTVHTGDTLQSMAQSAYGDSSLWYRIAEANGLSSGNDLKVGQTLNIPNRVSAVSNNGSTFKPYDPSRIQGDTTPNLSTPEPEDDFFGEFLMAVVTVVVAAVAPQFLPGFITSAGPVAIGAASAAVGSIAGQVVGLATGTIDHFSWGQVALSAISGAVTAGIKDVNFTGGDLKGIGNTIVRAAIANAVTQGIGVVTGLQSKFDWRGVAASGIAAGVGGAVGEALGLPADGTTPASMQAGEFIAKSALKSFSAGLTAAVARGGKVAIQQVAVDALGNALGGSLAGEINSSSYSETAFSGQEDMRDAAMSQLVGIGGARQRGYAPGQLGSGTFGIDDFASIPAFSGGRPAPASSDPQEAFRQSELDYRSKREPSVAGSGYVARSGDSISRIIGSSNPQAIGNFMRANGLTSSTIEAGRNYFVPDSATAYGDSAALGQAVLNGDNARLQALANQRATQQQAYWDSLQARAGSHGGTGVAYGYAPIARGGNFFADDAFLGAAAGVATSFGSMATGAARLGSNMLMQIGDILTGGVNHDSPLMQQVWAEQRALGTGVVNAITSPIATTTDLIESTVNRYDSAMAQKTDFDRSYELARLFNDVGQGVIGAGSAIRGAARLGAAGVEYIGALGNVTTATADSSRGLSKLGGVFTSATNEAGGTVWTSEGPISQNDFAHIVNSELMQGRDVNIITGVHGNVDGTIASVDAQMHQLDVLKFGEIPGVTVHNFPDLTAGQLKGLLNGTDTVIGGFCSSGVCLAPYR